jgi:transitional endoplasmic reticulum ATPase
MATGNLVKARINRYEEAQKRKLVELGQSKKSYQHILAYLKNEINQSTQMCNFDYQILCFKDDGVYQLNKAIEEIYGVAQGKGEAQVSGGESKLETVDVQLADGTRIKVPYGRIDLPDAGKDANIQIQYSTEKNLLLITGSCEYRFSSMIDEIVAKTKERLTTESIYKNQAIELVTTYEPKILDLTTIDKEFMILSDETEYNIKPLKARITQAQKCVDKGISLKFGALLEGTYGTGKTLLAFKLAKLGIENNWIFIYLKDPTLLAQTLRLAHVIDKNGNGIILFVEDIDQVTRGNRDTAMQDILNTLDGGDTKSMNVITLFTTNHIELIEPTFLRGKRIGSVISLTALDAATAYKFIKFSFEKDGYTLDEAGLPEVLKLIEENEIVPAFMAEIIESVKSNMILSDESVVKASYIENAVKAYRRQRELSRKKDLTETVEMKLASSMKTVIGGELLAKFQELSEELHADE